MKSTGDREKQSLKYPFRHKMAGRPGLLLFGRDATVPAKLIAHFIEQFLGGHNTAKEHIYRLERRLMHPVIK
jgi:hypothetical protein